MFKGSIAAIVTPMQENGELDESSFRNLLKWHLEQDSHGIVVNGTTGESITLTNDERTRLIQIAIEICGDRIPVLAGTGTSSTVTTIQLTKEAIKLGVAGCLIVTPYYNKPTQEGLFAHFKAIAESCDVPIILYNLPSRTACDMLPATVAKLAKFTNIIGIKEGTGDISRVKELRETCGADFSLLSGDDKSALKFIQAGGDGVISATANVVPREVARMCEFMSNGDLIKAEKLDERLQMLHEALMIETNPIPIKWALYLMGFIGSGIRLPLTELSAIHRPILEAVLKQVH